MANNSCYITYRTRKDIVFICLLKGRDRFIELFMQRYEGGTSHEYQ